MVHSDDDGLVIPPRIAPVKAAILPISKDESVAANDILPKAKELAAKLDDELGGMFTRIDTDFHTRPGDRFFTHIQKGVPLRLELGEKDLAAGTVRIVRRDTGEKMDVANDAVIPTVKKLLDDIQANLFTRAKSFREANTHDAKTYDELREIIDKQGGFVRAYFGGTPEDEVRIREETGATPRCVLPGTDKGKCIITGNDNARLTVFAKAY